MCVPGLVHACQGVQGLGEDTTKLLSSPCAAHIINATLSGGKASQSRWGEDGGDVEGLWGRERASERARERASERARERESERERRGGAREREALSAEEEGRMPRNYGRRRR